MLGDLIQRGFGTLRGLIGTSLDYVAWLIGSYRPYGRVDWHRAQRLMLVCRGNICRSPFAHFH